MKRPVICILAMFLVVFCSGCYWHGDLGMHNDRGRGGHDGQKHDNRGDQHDQR